MKFKNIFIEDWKRIFRILILFSFILNNFSLAQKSKDKKTYRFIFNNDGTEILGNRWHGERPLTVEDVQSYVDVVSNTQVTTFAICSGASQVYYKSKYERSFACPPINYIEKIQDTAFTKYSRNLKRLQDKGTNIIKICIDRAKEKGLEAFISMRMNDLHFTDPGQNEPIVQSDFWIQHPEYWVGEYPAWHAAGGLNFVHKEVREYKLNLIREQCEMFNLDGFELDFQRFLVYFRYGEGEQNCNLITDFLQKARQIVNETGKKRGRPILLSIRIPPRLDLCLEKGLDIKTWVNKNLVDFITVSAHWTDDPYLPIKEFKKELGNIRIPIYASIELGQYYPYEFKSQGIYRGSIAHCLSEGADGLYLFNFNFVSYLNNPQVVIRPKEGQVTCKVFEPNLLKEFGQLETLKQRNKIYSLSDGIVELGFKPNTPLPVMISPWDEGKVKINLAENFSASQPKVALLFIRVTKGSNLNVFFNSVKLLNQKEETIKMYDRDMNLRSDEEVKVYDIPVNSLRDGNNLITVRSIEGKPCTLKRLEIAINYGDIEKHGYF